MAKAEALTGALDLQIEAGLPYCFGRGSIQQENVLSSSIEKFSSFLHDAFSGTFSESTRQYQNYLTSASALWIFIQTLDLTEVSIQDQSVVIDRAFGVLFSALILALIVVFFIKAQNDLAIKRLQSAARYSLYEQLPKLLEENIVRVQIDAHYFYRFSDLVSSAYYAYNCELSQKVGSTAPASLPGMADIYNLSSIQSDPRYVGQIAERERLIADLSIHIDAAMRELADRIRAIELKEDEISGGLDLSGVYDDARRIYQQSRLAALAEALRQLTDRYVAAAGTTTLESAQGAAVRMQQLIDKSKEVRFRTVWLEVALPAVFGLSALASYWAELAWKPIASIIAR